MPARPASTELHLPDTTRKLSTLLLLRDFVIPYRGRLVAAMGALVFTAAITLLVGQGIRILIDDGFNVDTP